MKGFTQLRESSLDDLGYQQRTIEYNLNQNLSFEESPINRRGINRVKIEDPDKTSIRTRRTWVTEEDNMVKQLVHKYGHNWSAISAEMGNIRSSKQIRDRWLSKLDPRIKKCEWTEEEDAMLVSLFEMMGRKWSAIAKKMPGRSEIMVKNRFKARFQGFLTEENVVNHNRMSYNFHSSDNNGSDSTTENNNKATLSIFNEKGESLQNVSVFPPQEENYRDASSNQKQIIDRSYHNESRVENFFLDSEAASYALQAGYNAQCSQNHDIIPKHEDRTEKSTPEVDPRLQILEKTFPAMKDDLLRHYLQQKITGTDSGVPQTKEQAAERLAFLQECLSKLQGVLLDTVKKLENILTTP